MDRLELHQNDQGPLPHLLALPAAAAAAGRRHPLLCFLHGYDEGAPMPLRQALTLHGPLAAASAAVARSDFIVMAPQLPTRGDHWWRHGDAVRELLARVQQQHGADPRRTYLTGFSFGGNGVFDLALQQPGVWAALWAVDPTRVPRRDPGLPVWLSSGEISRHQQRAFVQRLDLVAPQEGAAGARIYVDQGQDHVGTARLAYQNDRIYRWLLSHSAVTCAA
ncbi:alpha/beta hydrolase-fold protein [Caldimonas brevitalea]|uniref:Esterase n=1 Tax=Caldimonas brevitalea TaxID=413882 RepID=A0A0G3BN21_9BURK|nr:alpha/beta hydrolase-fold protein [Caldimonas brevitalea]AKJ29383.1 hypothetical protein AAW51_2692 [Caldimonas brevitalea]